MKASKNITKTTLLTILAQLPAHVFGIVAGIFITRILGPEDKGLFTIFNTNINLFITLFGFTVSNSIIYFVSSKKIAEESIKSIAMFIITLTLLFTLITLAVWLNTKFSYLFMPDYSINIILILLFLSTILITQINLIFTAYFQGIKHFKIVNQILMLNGFYSLIVFAIAYLLNRFEVYSVDLIDVILLSILVLLMNTAHWLYYYVRLNKNLFRFNLHFGKDLKIFLKFTGLNHFANILIFLNQRMIIWFIAFYLDNWHLGIFSVGIGLAQLLYFFSSPISLILESFLSAQNQEKQNETFAIFSRLMFTIVLLICIVVLLVSSYVIPWLYGKEFYDSAVILNVVIFGILLSSHSSLLSSLFLAKDKLKYNVISSVFGVLTTLITAPIFIQKYQLMGAAYAQLATYTIIFTVQYYFVNKHLFGNTNIFFLTRKDIRFLKKQLLLAKEERK